VAQSSGCFPGFDKKICSNGVFSNVMKFHACVAIASYFLAVKAFTPSVYNFLGSDGKTAISELSSYFDINQDGVISLKEYQYGLAEAVEKGYAPAGILDNAGGLVCAVDGEVEVKVPVFQKCITKKFKKMKVSDWLQSKAYRGFDLDAAVVLAVNDKRRQKCGPNAPEVSDVDLQKCRNRSECIKALMECPSENEVNSFSLFSVKNIEGEVVY
jgi:hypothetical protein